MDQSVKNKDEEEFERMKKHIESIKYKHKMYKEDQDIREKKEILIPILTLTVQTNGVYRVGSPPNNLQHYEIQEQLETLKEINKLANSKNKKSYSNFIRLSKEIVQENDNLLSLHPLDPNSNLNFRINNIITNEFMNMNKIKKTFSSLGFNKMKIAPDVFSSMISYYENNAHQALPEIWDYDELHLNWWESDSYVIHVPIGLKVS